MMIHGGIVCVFISIKIDGGIVCSFSSLYWLSVELRWWSV